MMGLKVAAAMASLALAGAADRISEVRDFPSGDLPFQRFERSASDTRYVRKRKGWTGGGYKGSSEAKAGARLAAKRAKASKRARAWRKHVLINVGPAIRSGAIRGVTFGASR